MAATVSNRFLTVQGPMKMEVLNLTTVTTADTVTTNMARPLFAAAIDNTGGSSVSVNTGTSISGKTITITNSSYAGAGVCILIVFGF